MEHVYVNNVVFLVAFHWEVHRLVPETILSRSVNPRTEAVFGVC